MPGFVDSSSYLENLYTIGDLQEYVDSQQLYYIYIIDIIVS